MTSVCATRFAPPGRRPSCIFKLRSLGDEGHLAHFKGTVWEGNTGHLHKWTDIEPRPPAIGGWDMRSWYWTLAWSETELDSAGLSIWGDDRSASNVLQVEEANVQVYASR